MQRKLLGITKVDFYAVGHVLIIYSAFVKYSRENENRVKQLLAIYRLQESL
jgi:hypothetical protein